MKASDARHLTQQARTVDMRGVYRNIEIAARNGQDSIQIQTEAWRATKSVDNVIADLRANGYTVKHETGYDQRDRDSWDYLTVSW